MATILEARVKQKVDTEVNWLNNPLILLEGEQAFVVSSNGTPINFKIGDGTKTFSQLPYYFDASIRVPFFGIATPSSTPSPATGDGFWIATQSGTYTNYGGVVLPEDAFFGVIARVGGSYIIGAASVDLSGYISSELIGAPNGIASLDSEAKVLEGQLPLSYGESPNGQLLNPANTVDGLGIAASTYQFFFGVAGAKAVWFPVEPNTQITISWEGGNESNRFIAYVDENKNPISAGGSNNLGHTINGRLGTVTTPNNSAIKGAYIQTARSTANEPVPPTWVKVQLGSSATAGHEFEGGVEKIANNIIVAEYAKKVSSGATLEGEVSESANGLVDKSWIYDQINKGVVDNGQLINPANNQVGSVVSSGNGYEIRTTGTNAEGLYNRIDLTTPELENVNEFYYSDFGGWAITQRFNRWEDSGMNLIQGFTQTADGVIIRPEGAAYLVIGVKRPNSAEPSYTGLLKVQAGEVKTAGITYGGDKIRDIFGMEIEGADEAESEGILYVPSRLFFVRGLKMPMYKTSLVRHVDELSRDIVFSNPAVSYTDFEKPMYYPLSAGSWVDPDIMGAYGHIWTKDYDKPSEMRGVRVDLTVVDPATKDGVTFNLVGIGDSIPNNVFNSSVNAMLPHVNPNVTKINRGTRQIANTNTANDFRPAFSYSVYTGRSSRLGNYGSAPVVTPATDASQLNSQYTNPFLRLATATDKNNRPDWCFRSTGAFEEKSYAEDTDKTGDFWIFDFAHYLTWLDNPQVDVVYIALGSNDLLFFQSKGIEYAEAGLRRMLTSIIEVVPTAKIGVVPSPGRGESNDIWQMHCDWMNRLNIILADYPNVMQVPIHPYINRNFSYPLSGPNPIDGGEEGNNTQQWVKGDEVHIQVTGGVEYGRAVVSWLMNVI